MYVILNLMWKLLIVPLVVLVFGVSGLFLYKSFQTKQVPLPTSTTQASKAPSPTTEVASSPPTASTSDPCEVLIKGNSDVPPLYEEGITWEKTQVTEYEIPLGEEGSRKMSGCLIKTQNITDQKGRDVRIFYSGKMAETKWNPLTSADGMYSSIESYGKDSKYFVIQQNLAPGVTSPTQNPLVVIEVFYSQ